MALIRRSNRRRLTDENRRRCLSGPWWDSHVRELRGLFVVRLFPQETATVSMLQKSVGYYSTRAGRSCYDRGGGNTVYGSLLEQQQERVVAVVSCGLASGSHVTDGESSESW